MLVDLHTHPQAHGDAGFTLQTLEGFAQKAIERGCTDLGFSDHDLYISSVKTEAVSAVKERYPQINLRLGLEVDYRPGSDWGRILAGYKYDYLIGSVHEINSWIFDHPDYKAGYDRWQGDDLYREYFSLVAEAARSGLFQIMGHLDVIRVFNFKAQSPLTELARPALEAIAEAGAAIELNTNGRYKPVGDYYPAKELLQEAFRLGIPVTLGSDAHEAINVARDFEEGRELLKSIGYRSIVSFADKKRIEYPL